MNFNKISKNIRNEISINRKEFQQIMSFLTDTKYLTKISKSELYSKRIKSLLNELYNLLIIRKLAH